MGFDLDNGSYLAGMLQDSQELRDRALIYMADYFQALAAHFPVVILLDDIHWADDSAGCSSAADDDELDMGMGGGGQGGAGGAPSQGGAGGATSQGGQPGEPPDLGGVADDDGATDGGAEEG